MDRSKVTVVKKEIIAIAIPIKDKEKLAQYAKIKSTTTSSIVRGLIQEFIRQKDL